MNEQKQQRAEGSQPPGSTPRPRPRMTIAPEGEDGLYSMTWIPVCRSHEVAREQVIGREFLGGKVVVYRDAKDSIHVAGGFCVHMGADLSYGKIVGDRLQCPFHHFQYGPDGTCVKTGAGVKPPRNAALFKYPVQERWGLVWAFNGETPLWELPSLQLPDADLVLAERDAPLSHCDAYMVTANAFDWQHFATLHDFHATEPMRQEDIDWQPYRCGFRFLGRHWQGEAVDYRIEVLGTNVYIQQGLLDGRWYALIIPMGIPAPGRTRTFLQVLVAPEDETPEARTRARHRAESLADLEMRFVEQDRDVLNNLHFGAGHLISEDHQLVQFMKYLKQYPRGNPGQHFLD